MKTPRITVYTSTKCAHCKQLKQWLLQNNLRFQEFNIETSQRGRKTFLQIGGRAVPLTQWNGEIIAGFDRKTFIRKLSGK